MMDSVFEGMPKVTLAGLEAGCRVDVTEVGTVVGAVPNENVLDNAAVAALLAAPSTVGLVFLKLKPPIG